MSYLPKETLRLLITFQDFWQEMNISRKTVDFCHNWTYHFYRRKPYVFDHFSKYLTGNEHFEKNGEFLSQLDISIFDQKMMVSTAGRKTQLHHYWWSYGWIGFCSYDSGTMAYSDYSTSAVVRVRASSPAWRYHYNVRLYSIDFRWVIYQILNNVILRVRASSPRHDDIIIMSDYILLIFDELYIKFWIMSFWGSGRAARGMTISL